MPPPLVALTPGGLERTDCEELLVRARSAVGAGLRGILLRERGLFDRDFLSLARELRKLLGDDGWLGIHDRAHLLTASAGDALHLGWWSLEPTTARALVGTRAPIGFSAHADDPAGLRTGSDYLFLAPVAQTRSHPTTDAVDWRPPLGVDGVADEVRRSDLPVWALGGVDVESVGGLRRAGVRGIAVLGAILGRDESGAVAGTEALLRAWENAA